MALARDFLIRARAVPCANNGLHVLGDQGAAAVPQGRQGGLLCVQPPLFRSKLASSAGNAGVCDGQYTFTLQDLIDQAPIVSAGVTLHVQIWARDLGNADGFLVSDGLTFDVCP